MVRFTCTLMLGLAVLLPAHSPRRGTQTRGTSAGTVSRPDAPVTTRGGTSRSGYIIASS